MNTAQTVLTNGGENLKVASPGQYSLLCAPQCHSINVLNCPPSRSASRMSHCRWSLWLVWLVFPSAVNLELNPLCARGWLQIGYSHVTEKPIPQFQIYWRLEKMLLYAVDFISNIVYFSEKQFFKWGNKGLILALQFTICSDKCALK